VIKDKNCYFSGVRLDAVSLLPKRSFTKILEIGGGNFDTSTYIKEVYGATELWGVDIRRISNTDINLITGSIEDPDIQEKIPNGEFDLIIANDVVEHLIDTEGFLEFAYQKLAPKTLLLVSVPNVRNIKVFWHIFLRNSFPRADSGLFDKTHLRWFTRRDITEQASKKLRCIDHRYSGRYIRKWYSKIKIFELVALQNIILCKKE